MWFKTAIPRAFFTNSLVYVQTHLFTQVKTMRQNTLFGVKTWQEFDLLVIRTKVKSNSKYSIQDRIIDGKSF